jgi:hypothetical protein
MVGAAIFSYLISFFIHKTENVKAPVVGRRSWSEPFLLLRYRFCQNASSIVSQGYKQVSLPSTVVVYAEEELSPLFLT